MASLHWRSQTIPYAALVARTSGGRFEIELVACAYAFIADEEIGHAVRWHPARSLQDAQERCEMLHRNSDDQSSGRTVSVQPGRL